MHWGNVCRSVRVINGLELLRISDIFIVLFVLVLNWLLPAEILTDRPLKQILKSRLKIWGILKEFRARWYFVAIASKLLTHCSIFCRRNEFRGRSPPTTPPPATWPRTNNPGKMSKQLGLLWVGGQTLAAPEERPRRQNQGQNERRGHGCQKTEQILRPVLFANFPPPPKIQRRSGHLIGNRGKHALSSEQSEKIHCKFFFSFNFLW